MIELWDILDKNGDKTGRLHERGKPMYSGDYHLVVHVWIVNTEKQFLISRMIPGDKDISGLWQTTGGCAVAGDDSLTTALKETSEEIGIALNSDNGRLFEKYIEPHFNDDGAAFCDVWLFKQDIDISTVVLKPDETCDVMWATSGKILQMVLNGTFRSEKLYPYLNELFKNACRHNF